MTTTVIEALTEARNLVAAGWTQGRFRKPGSPVSFCASGALYEVVGIFDSDLVRKALERALPEGYEYLVDFNDEPGRTQAEVVALFDLAIEMQDPDFLV